MSDFDNPSLSVIRRRLLDWFDKNRRDLPWRHDRDPYRIWISEVMLQQTQVAAVIPYFHRFLEIFPTVCDLARAKEVEVLRVWEGLGYYRRARHLHQAAQILVTEQGGALPNDPEVWRRLPGVGRYILGAVLSQAFERRVPIVEANSQRVLCRLFGLRLDPKTAPGAKWLWEKAATLVPPRRPGDFNQALMELGALVCKSEQPRCADCPLTKICTARRFNQTAHIPVRAARPAITHVHSVAVAVRKRGTVLVVRRPSGVRWADLWEFPHGTMAPAETAAQAANRVVSELTGVRADLGRELLVVRHAVTRYRIALACWDARFRAGRFRSRFYSASAWLRPDQLGKLPFSAAQRKFANHLVMTQMGRG